MKLNMLKALIKKTAENEMPDVYAKIDLATINIIPEVENTNPIKRHFSFSRVLQFAVLVLVLGFTSVIVYALVTNSNVTPQALISDEEVIGFQAISATAFIGSLEPLSLAYLPLETPAVTPDIADQITNLNTYINVLETLVGDKDSITFETAESSRLEYEYYVHFESIDLLDQVVSYGLYFNKTLDSENANVTHLEGVMVQSENEYALLGTITETASGNSINLFACVDQNNYVSIEDQSTKSKQSYRYTVYENGIQMQQVEMGLTLTDNRICATVNYEQDDDTVEFQISRVENNSGTAQIRVRYTCKNNDNNEEGDIDVAVEYNQTSSSYQYRFMVTYRHGNQSDSCQYTGSRTDKASENGNGNSDGNGNGQGQGNGNRNSQSQDINVTKDLIYVV
ncbi:MAG: hypothetical protein WC363_01630 [Candidatus Izemoplasmatales bacterium]|jgi:hypothetical protein